MLNEEEIDGIGEMLESGDDSATVDEPDEVEHVSEEATETDDGDEGKVPSHEEFVPYDRFRQANERVKELEAQLASDRESDDAQAPSDDKYAALDQRLATIEGARREAEFVRELDSVKQKHPVFQSEGAEGLLLDAIIANPDRNLKEVAAGVEKQLRALGLGRDASDSDADQPSRAGATSGASRAAAKPISNIEDANAAALKMFG